MFLSGTVTERWCWLIVKQDLAWILGDPQECFFVATYLAGKLWNEFALLLGAG